MIKVILNGCSGKMGKMVIASTSQFENMEIVAGIDKFKVDLGFPIFDSPEEVNIEYDVLLDFSRADALNGLLSLTEKTKKPLVICSTGFSKEDLALIDEKSKTLPLFRSANMSLGINLINNLLKKVAPLLYGNYDIEIVEKIFFKWVYSSTCSIFTQSNTTLQVEFTKLENRENTTRKQYRS